MLSKKLIEKRKKRGISTLRKQHELRSKVHKIGKKALKAGTHPQMWRARGPGGKLGPVGELGEDVIIEVYMRGNAVKVINLERRLSLTTLKRIIATEVYRPLAQYIIEKINEWVPKDTGSLRDAMIGEVKKGQPTIDQLSSTTPFRVVIGTPNIPYAGPVNKMPDSWLKHTSGTGRFGDPLNDPKAKREWYNLVRVNGRNKAQQLWRNMVKNQLVPIVKSFKKLPIKNPYNFVRGMFKVTFK